MAKKKVKTQASLLAAAAVASVHVSTKQINIREQDDNHDNDNDTVTNNASTDNHKVEPMFFTARLKGTIGKSASLHQPAQVRVALSDALQWNASVGDDVIILSWNNEEEEDIVQKKQQHLTTTDHKYIQQETIITRKTRIRALAVLPIEIHKDHNQQSSDSSSNSKHPTSPVIVRKNTSQQQWNRGTIQFTSSSVLERFTCSALTSSSPPSIHQRLKDLSMVEDSVASSLHPIPSIVTPVSQPATTPFSFKNLVSTPSPKNTFRTPGSSSTTKSKYKTDVNNKRHMVKVIPCRTALGRFLLQSRTSICSKVTIEAIEDPSSNSNESAMVIPVDSSSFRKDLITSSIHTLERLVNAHIMDSYVMLGQNFRISFTGKPFHFRIIDVAITNEPQQSNDPDPGVSQSTVSRINDEPLVNAFSSLCIENKPVADDGSGELRELYTSVANSNIHLYHILRTTQIIISNTKRNKDPVVADKTVEPPSEKSTQFVAGLSTTLEELRSILLTPLCRPELFTSRGMKIPRGVLLHGPNGVGKTSLAKQFLLEVDHQLNHSQTQYVHCASLQSKSDIVGEAESALSKLFRPSKGRPTLLVLDDIHLICSKRGSGGSSQGMDRLAATLLALMDGIEGNGYANSHSNSSLSLPPGNVVILAITTNPSILDPALRRPGRLDAEVEVPLPEDALSRAEIIQFHVSNFGIEIGEDLKQQNDFVDVAKAAKGFNGADCMLAVKEAIRFAILETTESRVVLKKHHLLAAMRTTKPSAIKSITVEIPQVLWSSIGGMDSVKRDLREAIELPLTHNEYFEQLRVPPPRGILLYGPPGCSKTLMARALATEGNMNFLAVKGPELLSKWLGESERALSSLFRRARMASPAIVFFDEIDAIASKRGSGDSASSGRLLSQLLTELDGVNYTGNVGGSGTHTRTKPPRVVVVGATNRPDLLDIALTRPGRIDRMIYVGPPDAASRAQILRITLQKSSGSTGIDISSLADDGVTGGFSGAEMVAICRDAALLALEEDEEARAAGESMNVALRPPPPTIEMRHLTMAIQSMPRQITPSMVEFYKLYQENVTVI